MAVTALWYRLALAHAWGGITAGETTYFIDYLTDTIKVSLHTSSYTPAQATHDFWNDCTNEISNSGTYSSGGATLSNKTLTYTGATNVLMFDDTADLSWTSMTASPRYAVIYKSGASAATSPLMGYVNFGTDAIVVAGTLTISWAAAGIFTITPA